MKLFGKKIETSTIAGVGVLLGTAAVSPQVGQTIGSAVNSVTAGDPNSIILALAALLGNALILWREKPKAS